MRASKSHTHIPEMSFLHVASWIGSVRRLVILAFATCCLSILGAGLPSFLGDLDADGRPTVLDLVPLINHLNGTNRLSSELLPFGDVNEDGAINQVDVDLIGDAILGIAPLPNPYQPPIISAPVTSTNGTNIVITGVARPNRQIIVQGGLETVFALADSNGNFTVGIPLQSNRVNNLFLTTSNRTFTAGILQPLKIIQDSQPPNLFVDFPTNGSDLTTSETTVAGRVGDMLSGFMGLTVTLSNFSLATIPPSLIFAGPANVDVGIGNNGTFEQLIPLADGTNRITTTARDIHGNVTNKQIIVRRVPLTGPRMFVDGGDRQMTNIHRRLARPIVVRVTQADGITPIPNKLVTFEVIRSDGRLRPLDTNGFVVPGPNTNFNGGTMLQVFTDPGGRARAGWALGGDAGCGNNRVAVTSKDISGSVFFCASANPLPPTQINIGSGNNQKSEVGSQTPEPLRVWVSDSCNGAESIPVTFTVLQGGGRLLAVNGSSNSTQLSLTIPTSRTGHADVLLQLGPDAGPNVVQATFPGNRGLPATFVAQGVARNAAKPTTFTGVILDNASQPIGGVWCRLLYPASQVSTYSDVQGRFTFTNVPPGPTDLNILGSYATTLGGSNIPSATFPALSYSVTVIPNAENSLPRPVLLPRLERTNQVTYYGTNDLVLTCKGIAGLKMTIKANSMRLPDGTQVDPDHPAYVSLNQVHHDSVPMAVPDGASPAFAWTLQPGRSTFDPPIQIEYPNMTGLPAGTITYFLSYNHDTERFDIVASGHVKDDSATIVTDPGAGLSFAGWGCNCPPYAVAGDCTKPRDNDPTNNPGDTNAPPEKIDPNQEPQDENCPHPPEKPSNQPSEDECSDNSSSNEPDNEPASCPTPSTKTDPIFFHSGEVYLEVEDLRIKGRGMDFVWSRKYRSKLGLNTAQGNSWDSSYNIFVEPDGQDFFICNGKARKDLFRRKPDGTFTRKEFFRDLVLQPDGRPLVTLRDQQKWRFWPINSGPQQGKVETIEDRNGNTITLHYSASGRLIRITDTLSRDILVGYNANGFIESVTDFAGRSVRYTYYGHGETGGSFGDLKSVTTPAVTGTPNGNDFPNGKTTTYTYTTGFADDRLNHNLLTITDGRRNDPTDPTFGAGPYVVNTYAATTDPNDINFDRVTRQIWGGGVIDFVYVPVAPAVENEFASTRTIVNDRVGNVREYFFDRRNRLVIQREFTGRADPAQPTTATHNRPVLRLRPDDPPFFETRYVWNTESLVRLIVHPRGNKTVYTYEADLDPSAPQRTKGNLREIRRLPFTNATVTAELNGQSIIIEQFQYDSQFAGGSCCGHNFVTLHADARGNVTRHSYDTRGNRTRTVHRINSIVEDFEYNQFGQLTAHVHPNNGTGHRRRDEFAYYTNGFQRGYLRQQIVDGRNFALATTYEYDAVGNQIRVIDPRGHDHRIVVNQLDEVVREISPEILDGSGIRYTNDFFYDANDNLVRTEIQNRRALVAGWNSTFTVFVPDGSLVETNPTWTTTYEYELLNHLVRKSQEVRPGRYRVTEYAYDLNRNHSLTRFGEATAGRQSANAVQMLYDERDLRFREIRAADSPDHSTAQFDYDANKNRIRRWQGIEDGPRITEFRFDAYDRLAISADPMGNVTTQSYDANGNRVHTLIEGELLDVPGSAANVRLSETAFAYDEMNRLFRQDISFFDINTGAPIGDGLATTLTLYSDTSQIVAVLNDNNHGTTNRYDTANRLSIVTDAKGNTVSYAYDADNNVSRMVEVEKSDLGTPDEAFTTTYSHDNLNRLIATTDNVGNLNRSGYDARNNRTLTIDANTNVVHYFYDGLSRLTDTIREMTASGVGGSPVVDTIVTRQEWDDTSRLIAQIDDNENATRYVYDALNRRAATIYADDTSQTNLLDVHDNITSVIDANSNIVACTYDLLDRLVGKQIAVSPGVSPDTTFEMFTFDGLSRLAQAQDNDSLVARKYDSLSGIVEEVQGLVGFSSAAVRAAYDGVGNLLFLDYPSGRIIKSTYDPLERKKAISSINPPNDESLVAEYFYIGPSRIARHAYGNGTRCDYDYDGMTGVSSTVADYGVKRLTRTRHYRAGDLAPIEDRTYAWDRMGNKTRNEDIRSAGPQWNRGYAYDSGYRLTTRLRNSPATGIETVTYNLDGVGNRTSVVGGTNAGSYLSVDTLPEPGDHQLNQYTVTPSHNLTYDRMGNLVRLNLRDAPSSEATVLAYSYANRPVGFTNSSAGIAVRYSYDVLGRRVAKTIDGPNEEHVRFLYNGLQEIEERRSDEVFATFVHGGYIDALLSMRCGGRDYYYHCDEMYNVMCISDTTGIPVERYEYDDYGIVSLLDANGQSIPRSYMTNSHFFSGRRLDMESQFYFFRTRYLDPVRGRFITRDHLDVWGDPANIGNPVAFVGSNPASYADPLGLMCIGHVPPWIKPFEPHIEAPDPCSPWHLKKHREEVAALQGQIDAKRQEIAELTQSKQRKIAVADQYLKELNQLPDGDPRRQWRQEEYNRILKEILMIDGSIRQLQNELNRLLNELNHMPNPCVA